MVGFLVGDSVGVLVGAGVGDTVGSSMGDLVGSAVGAAVGVAVGSSGPKGFPPTPLKAMMKTWGDPLTSEPHRLPDVLGGYPKVAASALTRSNAFCASILLGAAPYMSSNERDSPGSNFVAFPAAFLNMNWKTPP